MCCNFLISFLCSDFFARVILCNSLVWQCSLTGKANLTFQEALDSELAARKQIKGFPKGVWLLFQFCNVALNFFIGL